MSMAETSVVLAGVVLPGIVVLAVVLFALYWIIRKAVRDGIRDVGLGIGQKPSAGEAGDDQASVRP